MIRQYHLKKGQNPYWIRTIRTRWHVCNCNIKPLQSQTTSICFPLQLSFEDMQPFPHRHQLATKQLLYLNRIKAYLASQDKLRMLSSPDDRVTAAPQSCLVLCIVHSGAGVVFNLGKKQIKSKNINYHCKNLAPETSNILHRLCYILLIRRNFTNILL